MLTIIDYGAGNLRSIANMLRALGIQSRITNEPTGLHGASGLILPGVGHFDFGMKSLRSSGMLDVLEEMVLDQKVPLLGICLGAQLLTRRSDEGSLAGLGWIEGETVRFDRSRLGDHLRVPHMGWSDTYCEIGHPLFAGFQETPRFYYVHSFHLRCERKEDELCYSDHGYRFVSGVYRDNILGVQFHPEKSHRFGKVILRNFANLVTKESGRS